MSDLNKVARQKSFLSKFSGIFRKKKKDTGSSRSQSQSQPTTEGQFNQETTKNIEHGIYRKVITPEATSSHGSSNTSSIDPVHVSVAPISAEDKQTDNLTSKFFNSDNDGKKIDNGTSSNSEKETQNKFIVEKELVDTINKDLRTTKLKINDTDEKILIHQNVSDIKIESNTGKQETTKTEIMNGRLTDGKISSEIMKRKWFNDEISEDVEKDSPVAVVISEKIESKVKNPLAQPEILKIKSDEIAAITTGIILEEKHIKVEEHEELKRDESLILLKVERNEINPEENYFTTGKYASYFLLEIEKQYYDPTQVYSMVRYRDSEDSDDSDSEGENSSSESSSPNIPATMRRRLLHRRSADNLIVNSPTNSMRHSSPESVKSAPIQLKPRSTSHDALSKRKDKQASQVDGISMDSLAKQSLLAAQVLNLIPAQKARDRNFLHGRIAANSLLGPVELEKVLPNREIKIFVGTWNMNGQSPPKELNDFMLPSGIETIPDMLAIGTQESYSERNEWEAALQETLGPSHVLLTSTGLGTLHLALFVRRDLIWFCSVPEDDNFSTRTGTAFRTKGAVALAIMLFGTSFLFVTAHLTAHQDKVKERVNDIKRIVRNLDLPKDLPTRNKHKDVTQNFDCVFWCGDLNFRLSQPREEVIQWISNTQFPQESPINLHKDQLRTVLNEGAVLRGFEEAAILFPPTYKYDPGTQNFDSSSKQRTPAYTDRILFKGKDYTRSYIRRVSHESENSHKDGTVECLVYDSVPSICTSDHKPVWGVFKTTIRPGIDTIPLAAGLFNREVYLEGIKRRAAAMDDSQGTSRISPAVSPPRERDSIFL